VLISWTRIGPEGGRDTSDDRQGSMKLRWSAPRPEGFAALNPARPLLGFRLAPANRFLNGRL